MKRMLSSLLALVLMLSLFSASGLTVSAAETETASSPYAIGSAKLESIVDVEALKATICEALYRYEDSVDLSAFSIPNTEEYDDALFDLVFYEIPEAFLLYGFVTYNGDENPEIIETAVLYYSYSQEEHLSMLEKLRDAKRRLLHGIANNPQLSDVEKALLIHDRLALHCEYDYAFSEYCYEAYGALVDGKAVCSGYAGAYLCLLEEVGIPCRIVISGQLNHAWNMVYIDGIPYHVDVTWDDISWGSGKRGVAGAVYHMNFLRSSDGIYQTGHRADDYDTSATDTTYDNAFGNHDGSPYQLVGDDIYYIDFTTNQLKRLGDGAVILNNVGECWESAVGPWGNFACLASDGTSLYYSLSKAVYKVDIAKKTSQKIWSPTLSTYENIYGLEWKDGYLICDINNTPYWSEYEKHMRLDKKACPLTPSVTQIAVAELPYKTVYKVGDRPDGTGLRLSVTYSDGSKATVTSGFLFDEPYLFSVGTQPLTVSYGGAETTFEVTVTSSRITGDVTGDGKTNIADAILLFAAASGRQTLSSVQEAAGDVNGDGKVNIVDAMQLFKTVSGR